MTFLLGTSVLLMPGRFLPCFWFWFWFWDPFDGTVDDKVRDDFRTIVPSKFCENKSIQIQSSCHLALAGPISHQFPLTFGLGSAIGCCKASSGRCRSESCAYVQLLPKRQRPLRKFQQIFLPFITLVFSWLSTYRWPPAYKIEIRNGSVSTMLSWLN